MRWRFEAATAPAPGSLCEGAARRCFAAWNIEESNDTSAGPSSKYSQAPPWRAPSQPCCASASRKVRVPGHRRVGVLHDANRWCRQTEAAALAFFLHSGSGKKMPPRGRGACTARTRIHCQRRCLLLTRAAQGLGGALQCQWHLTGGKQPIPGLTRWNIVGPPPPPAVLQGVPGSGGRSPARKGYPSPKASSRASKGTGAWHAARQAIQVHLSVHHPKRASSSSTSAQRPLKKVISPMP